MASSARSTFNMTSLYEALLDDSDDELYMPTTRPSKSKSKTFPQFRALPVELRLKIWALALPPRRTIAIFEIPKHLPSGVTKYRFQIVPESPAPAILFVNIESRSVALKHYPISFTEINRQERKIYFNPKKDELHLMCCRPGWAEPYPKLMEELKVIEALALSGPKDRESEPVYVNYAMRLLRPFESLKYLTCAKSTHNPFSWRWNEKWNLHARDVAETALRRLKEEREAGDAVDGGAAGEGKGTDKEKALPEVLFWDGWPMSSQVFM